MSKKKDINIKLYIINGLLILFLATCLSYLFIPNIVYSLYENQGSSQVASECLCNRCLESNNNIKKDSDVNAELKERVSISGPIGDTFGGTIGPFVALIGAILTGFAFWVQFEANKQQRDDIKIERFENKFYEMLKLHRDNVLELSINNKINGRNIFSSLFAEFNFGFLLVKKIMDELPEDARIKNNIPNDIYKYNSLLCNISYLIFYSGVGNLSNKVLRNRLEGLVSEELINKLIAEFTAIQHNYKEIKNKTSDYKNTEHVFMNSIKIGKMKFNLTLNYKPFNGHLIRLGHYYRHLIQTVKFIDEQKENEQIDRYFYAKNLRAQLSGHEQAMLYYNALSDVGCEWFNHPFFTDYAMIRNIPLSLADFGIKPQDHPLIKAALADDPSVLEEIEILYNRNKSAQQ